jgi:hypothetical protein
MARRLALTLVAFHALGARRAKEGAQRGRSEEPQVPRVVVGLRRHRGDDEAFGESDDLAGRLGRVFEVLEDL